MRLNVSVLSDASPAAEPLVVEAEPGTSVGAFTAELAGAVGGRPGTLFHGVTPLDPRLSLAEARIGAGAELGLNRPARPPAGRAGAVEVRLVGGPGAGGIVLLPPGEYEVGSAPACRVRLAGDVPPVAARLLVTVERTVEVTAVSAVEMDGKPLDSTAEWPAGRQVAIGGILLELATGVPLQAPLTRAPDGFTWEFNRQPRFFPQIPGGQFRLPVEPTKPDKSPVPLVTLLLMPAIGALVGILATGNWRFIFLALVSPLGALLTQFGTKRRGRQSFAEQTQEYEEKLARVRADIDEAVLEEQRARRYAYPDPAAIGRIATLPGERLWERRWHDDDFLALRVGTCSMPSAVRVEDPALDEHRRITVPELGQVPVALDVRDSGVVGVAGARLACLAPWLVAQAAVLHSPDDLRICVLTEASGEQRWSWLRWLPHVRPDSEEAYVRIGTSAESVSRRIAELNRVIAARSAGDRQNGAERGGATGEPDILVVFDGARRLRSMPGAVTLLRDGPAAGVYVLCLEPEERLLPEECRAVVVSDTGGASLRTAKAARIVGIRADEPDAGWYERAARRMAPLGAAGDGDDAVLPQSARLLDILELEPPAPEKIEAGWAVRPRSTEAVLGAGLDGRFAIDLVRDGPHALIAGTTGAGKSELLQTLVATLAVANRPDEMTFVLVDYKGGSAFAECGQLPHTVGMVTDLDTHLVERALTSLGAELRRREHVLADFGASDIVRYQERRARDRSIPAMPRLVLVIDEFASMVRELPDFVTGLVNIAQRGRSLGIHLVLATQRPSGAVTPDIRANTNLRIALRTTDQGESRDIIDAPDAGELSPRTPGRAYARLGYAALLPFQAGRIGGKRPVLGERADQVRVEATHVDWSRLGDPVPARRAARAAAGGVAGGVADTDLRELVGAIVTATERMSVPRQPSPWLPPLAEVIQWAEVPQPAVAAVPGDLGAVAYGIVDLPAAQSREPLLFDADRTGHVFFIGSSRSGRSQALRSLVAALAVRHSTADVHVYAIDCGNGALLPLAGLPHCGAVVDRLQTERLDRMLTWFNTELTRRQSLFGEQRVADLAEQRRSAPPQQRLPHLMLLVDRFEVFERDFATHDNGSYLERLSRLLRDGAGVGIHVVLAGDKVLGSGRFAGATEEKLVLRLNDRSDYSLLGLNLRDVPPEQGPGRAVRIADHAEAQIAVLGPDTTGQGQAAALTEGAGRIADRDAAVPAAARPRRFAALPDLIGYAEVRRMTPENGRPLTAFVGVGGDEVVPLGPDFVDIPTFAIGGPPRSGRSTALLTVARSLLENGTGLLVVAPRRSPLRDLAGQPGVTGVVTDAGIAAVDFRQLLKSIPEETGAVVIDDAELLAQSDIDGDLNMLARGAAGNGWGLVVAGNAEALSLGLAGWLTQLKRNRAGLLIGPQSITDGELIGMRIPRGIVGQAAQPGRAYLHLGDGVLTAVQVPKAD
ncbi:FtsK/SpoIIIE domain-containing protein [Micromonospora carbonacea]|uniref:DNA segregation ATPase FtsK/SpoIIIE, S-DNA-T family n=1 Tax=Micromonospora carbonacea TaxID=47853 RepID=A0A1C4VA53_9ACTN|nr:FtsK/SpoIIIE domain-containing protein [Micromonospora carbonacea]SCE80914.1 DNA segregation ATPase FtsK/SpoIIIE, S-DNA-T family [Micromonospora carbonacea]